MKITKKILCVLLAVSFIFASVSVSLTAFAANDMTFSISNVKKAVPGDTVTMKVTLANSKAVCVVNPTVEYDAEKLEFVSATNGDVFSSGAFMIGEAHEGKVRILYYNGTENTQKNGTVCTLKFKVLSGATGYADVKLDFPENSVVNAKEQAVSFVNKSGRVSIVSPVVYVDADENMKVDEGEEIEDKYYQKVPLFASYRDQSVKLSTSIVGDTIKSVEWSIDSDRLLLQVNEDGTVTVIPNRWWYCRANVTAKITSKSGEVLEKTVMVEFFKLAITKRLPVF